MDDEVRVEAEMNAAELLKNIEVLDPKGAAVRLGHFWEKQPIVLAFIRHFG